MPMALLWGDFSAHESDWMLDAIQKKMKVSIRTEEFFDDVLIVPVPNDFAGA